MPMMPMKRSLVSTLMLAVLAIPALALAGARAELHGSLAVGQPTQLDVTVDGDATHPPDLHIAGAAVQLTGQMAETSIVNGATSHQTKFVYTVTPAATGALDIPAIAVATAAGTQTTAPVHATVTASPARPSAISDNKRIARLADRAELLARVHHARRAGALARRRPSGARDDPRVLSRGHVGHARWCAAPDQRCVHAVERVRQTGPDPGPAPRRAISAGGVDRAAVAGKAERWQARGRAPRRARVPCRTAAGAAPHAARHVRRRSVVRRVRSAARSAMAIRSARWTWTSTRCSTSDRCNKRRSRCVGRPRRSLSSSHRRRAGRRTTPARSARSRSRSIRRPLPRASANR